jgi:hypothetical protein
MRFDRDLTYFLRVILAPDCLQSFPDSVWVPILLVLPGFAGLQGEFPFEIGKALDGFPLFPREFEIVVLKLVVKADLTGVRQSCAEIHPINPRPIVDDRLSSQRVFLRRG